MIQKSTTSKATSPATGTNGGPANRANSTATVSSGRSAAGVSDPGKIPRMAVSGAATLVTMIARPAALARITTQAGDR